MSNTKNNKNIKVKDDFTLRILEIKLKQFRNLFLKQRETQTQS